MGGFCLLVELHREGSALQPAQQACFYSKLIISTQKKVITPAEINIYLLCFVLFLLNKICKVKNFCKCHLRHTQLFACLSYTPVIEGRKFTVLCMAMYPIKGKIVFLVIRTYKSLRCNTTLQRYCNRPIQSTYSLRFL